MQYLSARRLPVALIALIPVILALSASALLRPSGDVSVLAQDNVIVQAGPGTITVGSSAIVGQAGKVLVITAAPEAGGGPVARLCAPLDSGHFSLPITAMTTMPGDSNPCGAATADHSFPEGNFIITAGIFVPPSSTPEKQTQISVTVSGNTDAALNGSLLSAALGDVDCDSDLDAVDALLVLRTVAGLSPMAACVGAGNVNCIDAIDAIDALFILRAVAALPVNLPDVCPPLVAV